MANYPGRLDCFQKAVCGPNYDPGFPARSAAAEVALRGHAGDHHFLNGKRIDLAHVDPNRGATERVDQNQGPRGVDFNPRRAVAFKFFVAAQSVLDQQPQIAHSQSPLRIVCFLPVPGAVTCYPARRVPFAMASYSTVVERATVARSSVMAREFCSFRGRSAIPSRPTLASRRPDRAADTSWFRCGDTPAVGEYRSPVSPVIRPQ